MHHYVRKAQEERLYFYHFIAQKKPHTRTCDDMTCKGSIVARHD